MPLIKREIQPAYVSRVKLQKGLVNEFESVSVSTLGGIIRQISSLAKYAEDVFDEIIYEADSIHKRATSLQVRISGLAQKLHSWTRLSRKVSCKISRCNITNIIE